MILFSVFSELVASSAPVFDRWTPWQLPRCFGLYALLATASAGTAPAFARWRFLFATAPAMVSFLLAFGLVVAAFSFFSSGIARAAPMLINVRNNQRVYFPSEVLGQSTLSLQPSFPLALIFSKMRARFSGSFSELKSFARIVGFP